MAKDRKDTESDPGAETEMFRAFVERSETYETRPAPKGPLIVAGIALLVAIVAFALIMGLQ
jgi:hypothetical protein